ncbi:MAG: ketopantoate reductase family protein [Crenarchaeota archaeon]|nr:ketopantoate reductase family protein [Thermoproteota archaeon]
MEYDVGVLGCGAVGSLVASALAAGGRRVAVFCLRQRRAAEIARGGIRLRGDGLDSLARVDAYHAGRLQAVKVGHLVVAVRAWDAVGLDRGRLRADTVTYVQPTVKLERLLAEPGAGLLALYACASETGEGVSYAPGVAAAAGGDAGEAAEALGRLGFRVRRYPEGDRVRLLWDYAAAHASVQPVAALLGVPLSSVARLKHGRALVESLAREAMLVMERRGVKPLRSPVDAAYELLGVRGCYPRMLQDLEAGRRTEVEYMNAAIAAEALRSDVYAAYNDTMYLLVKAREELAEELGLQVDSR